MRNQRVIDCLGGKNKNSMVTKNVQLKRALSLLVLSLTAVVSLPAAATITNTTTFASGTAVNATGPDSVTVTQNSVWIAYTNGADSTGKSGNSVVAQYDFTGKLLQQLPFPGYVDGLRYDDERGLVWVLQNQDGNSVLTLIDLKGKQTNYAYGVTSTMRGYDDVAFLNGAIFMSYTNPVAATDPTIQYMTGVNPITFATILTMGATGTNLATGATNQATTDSDTDSLVVTPFGGLMLTSGSDGQLIFMNNLEQTTPAVSFLQLIDSTGKNVTSVDDAVFVLSPSGSFYVADTGNNRVLKVDVTGLTPMSLYASAGSQNAVSSVDLATGTATPFITTAGGTAMNSPHGLAFVPSFNSLFGK
jgi:sugar lactone lactonase YvrE